MITDQIRLHSVLLPVFIIIIIIIIIITCLIITFYYYHCMKLSHVCRQLYKQQTHGSAAYGLYVPVVHNYHCIIFSIFLL